MKQKEIVGYNLAALNYLSRQEDAAKTVSFADDFIVDKRGVTKPNIEETQKKRKRIAIVS